MNIQVKIVKTFPQTEKLKAIVNITLDDCFAVHGIKIFDSEKGLFVTMPNIKTLEKRKDIFHPINKESREKLVQAILATYNEQQKEP
jgi:stage V sporulation protein G